MIIPFVFTFIIAVPPKGSIIIKPKTNTIIETYITCTLKLYYASVLTVKKINSNNNNNSSNYSNFNNNNSYYYYNYHKYSNTFNGNLPQKSKTFL